MNKKILLFTDWYEPAFKAGGPIRSCVNFVEQMHKEYDLYVFTGDRDFMEEKQLQGIDTNKWINHVSGAKVMYSPTGLQNLKRIIEIIKTTDPEYIYLNSMFSPAFTIAPLLIIRLLNYKGKVILSPRGMLKSSALKFKPAKKKLFLNLFKFLDRGKKIHFHATDQQEAQDIQNILDTENISVISNFPKKSFGNIQAIEKKKGSLKILFVGRIHPIKQLDYLLKLLESVSGTVHLTIVGNCENEAYWKACNNIIYQLPSSIKVEYLGSLPHESVNKVLQTQHIFALPTTGENFGHAIYEALCAGLPVLISDQTPWLHLTERNAGWDIPLHQPEKFHHAIQSAIDWDQEEFSIWSAGARLVVKEYLQKADLLLSYKTIFS